MARINALGAALVAKRKAAIDGRNQLGIEQVWLEDEDAYDGIDDLNRAQEASGSRARYLKPSDSSGTLTTQVTPTDTTKSTILPNITGPYVEIWAANIGDVLLPTDEWPFALDPTPVPELVEVVEQIEKMGPQQAVQMPGMPAPEPAGQVKDKVQAEIDKGKKCAEKAETRVKDWLTECQWHGETRALLDDVARIGTGVMKGPFPQKKRQKVWQNKDGVQQLIVNEEIKPVSKRIDPWKVYPDPACGEDIQRGAYIWEYDDITAKSLRELKGSPGYIDYQIDLCLAEGPQKPEVERRYDATNKVSDDTLYQIWYMHGLVDRKDLEAAGCDCSEMGEHDTISAQITMVNDRVIRPALNPLDDGSFPYDFMVCRKRPGMPWGQGIARQIRPAQQIITGATRRMMENAGLSAKPMLAVLRRVLNPVDGTWNLYGGKIFEVAADADVREVEHAIKAIIIDSRQVELLNIIQFALKMAEDITGMPLIMQGQQGKAPDTVGGLTILNNNTNTIKRRIARQFDYMVIEPHITRYYEWLQQYGEDEEEKGLFVVDARASTVLVERDIQSQELVQMGALVANPIYGKDPKKWMNAMMRAKRFDPTELDYDDEEWKQIVENMAKGPQDPRLEVAQLMAESRQAETAAKLRLEEKENAKDRRLDLAIAEMEALAERGVTGDELKAAIAQTVMKLRTQISLSREDGAREVMKPPTEPKGRAPVGQSFQK
jgi:hypothetical protein